MKIQQIISGRVGSLVIGFLIGSASSAIVCTTLTKRKYKVLVEEENSAMRDLFAKKMARFQAEAREEIAKLEEAKSVIINQETIVERFAPENIVVKEAKTVIKPDVPDYSPTGESTQDDIQDMIDYDEAQMEDVWGDEKDVELLTEKEWFQHPADYDVLELSYFEDDDMFVDEIDEPIHRPDNIFGEEAVDEMSKPHVKILYVRNHLNETDFVLTKVKGTYYEFISGPNARIPKVNRKMRETDE